MNAVTPAKGRCRPTELAKGPTCMTAPLAQPLLPRTREACPIARPARPVPARVVLLAAIVLVASGANLHAGKWPWSIPLAPPQQPHPAVARITVEESDGMAYGSGSLVDLRDRYGIVITNWHVVRDATGPINVVFPDGFRSAARVLRVDRDWDLAALLIWRPNATPLTIATQAPRPGEPLTIAGYGAGNYRSTTGRCTQYLAPSDHHPFELVELAVDARQGDSGGPIFNASGELAGVLFGSGGGTTSGSYAGRVRQFLATALPPGQNASIPQLDAPQRDSPQTIAATRRSAPPSKRPPPAPMQPLPENPFPGSVANTAHRATASMTPLPAANQSLATAEHFASRQATSASAQEPSTSTQRTPASAATFTWQDVAGKSLFQQCKTFLAILGIFTLLAQFSRLIKPAS